MREALLRPGKKGETGPQVQNKGGGDEVPIGSTPRTEGTTRLLGIIKKEEIVGHRSLHQLTTSSKLIETRDSFAGQHH